MCTPNTTRAVLSVIMLNEMDYTWINILTSFTIFGMTCTASNVQFGDVSKGLTLCKNIGVIDTKHILRRCTTLNQSLIRQPQKGKDFDEN